MEDMLPYLRGYRISRRKKAYKFQWLCAFMGIFRWGEVSEFNPPSQVNPFRW